MKKIIYLIYSFPYVILSMLLLWNDNSKFMAFMFFVTLLIPVVLGYVAAKKEQKSLLIKGNIISFVISFVVTLILNGINLVDELGGTWRGHFKPFYSEQFVVLITVVVVLLQIVLYNMRKSKI